MRKIFCNSTAGIDLNYLPNTNSGIWSNNIKLDGDVIYYLTKDLFDKIQLVFNSPLEVFGSEEFNALNDSILVTKIITYPEVGIDESWYLVSNINSYNSAVTLILDGAITDVEIGDSVIAENGATGIVVEIDGVTITIAYNSVISNFSEEAGSSTIHEGTAYDSEAVNTATIMSVSNIMETTMSEKSNYLAYYDSGAIKTWKFLSPFKDLRMTYAGTLYEWNTMESSDKRWKKI